MPCRYAWQKSLQGSIRVLRFGLQPLSKKYFASFFTCGPGSVWQMVKNFSMCPRVGDFLSNLPSVDGISLLPKSHPKCRQLLMLWDRWPVSQQCRTKSRQWRFGKERNTAEKEKRELHTSLQQVNCSLNLRAEESRKNRKGCNSLLQLVICITESAPTKERDRSKM